MLIALSANMPLAVIAPRMQPRSVEELERQLAELRGPGAQAPAADPGEHDQAARSNDC